MKHKLTLAVAAIASIASISVATANKAQTPADSPRMESQGWAGSPSIMPATPQERAWAEEPMVADGICEPYMACAMRTYYGL